MAINNPLIPGDPYSYDLKWIVDKLKEAIALYQPLNDKFDALSADFDALGEDFANLRKYVDNYFANLDITQEVSDKIEQMKANGYFDALIAEIISESGDLQQAVTDWLTEHVTPVGSAVTVDSSLTISGAAADAKVTGDMLEQLSIGNLTEFIDKINVVCGNYIEGYYISSGGTRAPLSGWGYYEKIPVQGGQFYNAKNTNTHIAFFTEGGIYISGIANPTGSFKAPDNADYLTYSIPVNTNTNQWIVRSTDQDLGYVSNTKGHLSDNISLKIDHIMEWFKFGRNLYNKYKTITGASFSYSDGLSRMPVLSNYHFTPDYIPCKPSTVYSWNYPCIIAVYDQDHNCLNAYNRTLLTDVRHIITDPKAAYLRISVNDAYYDHYMCVEGYGADNVNYEAFSLIERYPNRIITVKQDGSGDYTTIGEAIKNAPPNAPIYVYDGVYYETINAIFKPIRLIGSGKNCILSYSGLDYANPPLNMAAGYVSNMVIRATDSGDQGNHKAYCVHIDTDYSIDGSLVFENVVFQNEVHQCVGIGMRSNFKLVFNNCEFESNGSNAFYAHDWETSNNYKAGQQLILNNCTFKTTKNFAPIRLQSQELETGVASVTFKNNKAVRGGSGEIIEMILWGGRTLTNRNYLGSSDWILNEFSFNNYNDILNA